MKLEEIKAFLRNKKGYIKDGSKRLKKVLYRHGINATIEECKQAVREVIQEFKNPSKESKILFYDIETSYGVAKVWKPGYKLKVSYDDFIKHPAIICISYKLNTDSKVTTLTWDMMQDDKSMLEAFIQELNSVDFICGHNSDRFDLPWIRTRALYHNIDMLPKYISVDTLKIARSKFRFPSNRLDSLGDYLGVGRKIETGRKLWDDVILNNNRDALQQMVDYCEQDVLLLEEVYNKLTTQTLPTIHQGIKDKRSKFSSPYTGGNNIIKVKTNISSAGTIQHIMKCLDTGKYFIMNNKTYIKFLEQ